MTDERVARIVEVGDKERTQRTAVAVATIRMSADARAQLLERTKKGDALEAARIAALQAVKRTAELLPFCHPIAITGADVTVEPSADDVSILVEATVRAFDRTGVEMEALTAASIGALCLYDVAKAFDRGAVISEVKLRSKSGGRGGDYTA